MNDHHRQIAPTRVGRPLRAAAGAVTALLVFGLMACSGSSSDADAGADPAAGDVTQDTRFDRCDDPAADPDPIRTARVCDALVPAGTPLSAAAAAALGDGAFESYLAAEPEVFCPAAVIAIELAEPVATSWEERRASLLIGRDRASVALDTITAKSPPRWLVGIPAYATTMQAQLDALTPDSPSDAWNMPVEGATSGLGPLDELVIAHALSCD